jgi:hypothetical protein
MRAQIEGNRERSIEEVPGLEKADVAEWCRKLRKEQLHNLCLSTTIIIGIK